MPDVKYPAFNILIVDDDPAWLRSLALTLACSAGITRVLGCENSSEVMAILDGGGSPGGAPVRLVLLDITMPEPDGETLLRLIGERHPEVLVIIISGMNQLSTAVRCIKQGAFDYFVKTDPQEYLLKGVMQAIRTLELQELNSAMRSRMLSGQLRHPEAFSGIVTTSPAMLAVFQYAESVAPTSQPVLVTGESGVGKELLVRVIHDLSGRGGQLVALNVAGLDDAAFSDTFFGHRPGAFTGAAKARQGLVDRAAGGTLFLDEIGDLPPQAQIRLLRLLQEGEYYPLGSDEPEYLEARIVAATLQDLEELESKGAFRRDLYYRLHVHHIHIPPLRQRREDIPVLARHFLREAAVEYGVTEPGLPAEVETALTAHNFPGNVRELRNLVFDACGRCKDGRLRMEDFVLLRGRKTTKSVSAVRSPQDFFSGMAVLPALRPFTRALITEALRRSKGNQTLAARLLGITQSALSKRLRVWREQEDEASGPE